jgi:hypothetical protein
MDQFREIKFQDDVTPTYAEGIYDKRKFILTANDEETLIEGNFTDDERRFIHTQWEMKL